MRRLTAPRATSGGGSLGGAWGRAWSEAVAVELLREGRAQHRERGGIGCEAYAGRRKRMGMTHGAYMLGGPQPTSICLQTTNRKSRTNLAL